VVIGRAVNEATDFDKESINRFMKMTVPTMGPSTNFKPWKRNLLTFLSLKLRTSSRTSPYGNPESGSM
jgi:hypothetical protein